MGDPGIFCCIDLSHSPSSPRAGAVAEWCQGGVMGVSWGVFGPSGPRERNDRAEAGFVSDQVSTE